MPGANLGPHFGRPADYLRHLAAIGVSLKITRRNGVFHLDYRVKENVIPAFYSVQAAFPADEDWSLDCLFAVIALTGDFVRDMPPGAERIVDLAEAFARSTPRPEVRHMLARGVLQ